MRRIYAEIEMVSTTRGFVELADDQGVWFGSFEVKACRVIDNSPNAPDETAQLRGSVFERAYGIACFNAAVHGGRIEQIKWR